MIADQRGPYGLGGVWTRTRAGFQEFVGPRELSPAPPGRIDIPAHVSSVGFSQARGERTQASSGGAGPPRDR